MGRGWKLIKISLGQVKTLKNHQTENNMELKWTTWKSSYLNMHLQTSQNIWKKVKASSKIGEDQTFLASSFA